MFFTSFFRLAFASSVLITSLAAVLPGEKLVEGQGYNIENDTVTLDVRACQNGCGPHTPTPDGSCGPSSAGNFACRAGDCCSKWGWCGATDLHCGAGCNTEFGTCNGVSQPDPAPPTPPAANISPDGSCGPGSAGSYSCPAGNCCSSWGWCGATPAHCANCQKGFGKC